MTHHQELAECFSDMHKSMYGCRARFAYDWTVEELQDGINRLQDEIEEENNREQKEREELAAQCHVSVDQIIAWEDEQYDVWRYTNNALNMQTIDRDFIESLPVEPYEWAHELEVAA